ncbi:MAG: mandelate racemase/muconate lactonizing enzyme family protein [Firmicutes bacterium]|nr:mandelate racemase/muconate lactonizing enzyme family protein [Bacillota bacterium]
MKITQIETIRVDEFPNIVFVQLYTDEGVIGLGETFFGAEAVEAWIHESAAPYLLGQDPLQIDKHWQQLGGFLGLNSTGVENRGRSAIDFALWDIWGKWVNQPLYQLLGGKTHERVRVYNTCAGYQYVRRAPAGGQLPVSNWGVSGEADGPYEDLLGFLYHGDELAKSLISEGFTAMKIWPFDPYAEKSRGQYISREDLKAALQPFEKIRSAVGDKMEIMVEMHSLWTLPAAKEIAKAVEPYHPTWFEDPIRMDDVTSLREFRAATSAHVTASETLGTRWSYRNLLERRAVDIVMFDPSWVGGISESKKIMTLAEAFQRPVAPHDCTGPVEFAVAVHLSCNAVNSYIQEVVRAFFTGWYRELVTEVPRVESGYVYPLEGAGIGTELHPEVLMRADVHRRVSPTEVARTVF